MKIKMLESVKGSPNGVLIRIFDEGAVYEVGENFMDPSSNHINRELADVFVSGGLAEKVRPLARKRKSTTPPENKSQTPVEQK